MSRSSWWLFFAATIFLSAFLLFSVEPLVARQILPWFGGSAAVWSTCLVFYQTALLAGYAYALLTTGLLRPWPRALLHIILLFASLALLPIGPGGRWKPGAADHPAVSILILLTACVGLPFVVLSSTSPLLQAWLARRDFRDPYHLFAVSNFASLAALLAYPIVVEPALTTSRQSLWWSVLYVVFVGLGALVAWSNRKAEGRATAADELPHGGMTLQQGAKWFSLSACGSMLLLSVTNQIDENVAAVPLLWVLPLAIYLLTFVFGFGTRMYRRSLWLRFLAFALGLLGYAIYNIDAVEAIQISLPVFLGGLFVCCLFCHGELNRSRPDAAGLTNFYLMIAAGGAAGAIFVGLIAPQLFSGIYELSFTLIVTAGLALALTWNERVWPLRILWITATGCMVAVMAMNVMAYRANSVTLRRSFYGSLRVVQTHHTGPEQQRMLFHGTIEHGSQFLWPDRRIRPTTYYGPESGVGIVLRECFPSPRRIGVIGLGVGTIAAYGQAGDFFRFYEINSQVVDIARTLFFYLRETPAKSEIVTGDARLSLERDHSGSRFDVLVIDAFSGDAIPVHLLTREAVALYVRHLAQSGVLAFHVSNNYLDLAPVVRQLGELAGFESVLVHSHGNEDEATLPADWVLLTNNDRVLQNSTVALQSRPIASRAGLRPWTDDYNNLLGVFKTPELRR